MAVRRWRYARVCVLRFALALALVLTLCGSRLHLLLIQDRVNHLHEELRGTLPRS